MLMIAEVSDLGYSAANPGKVVAAVVDRGSTCPGENGGLEHETRISDGPPVPSSSASLLLPPFPC